ncbi:MAG: PqiC family protein [Paracoccaceae bacterium]
MRLLPILAALSLSGCATVFGPEDAYYAVPPADAGARIATTARTVEIAEVILPTYALEEQIATGGPGAALSYAPASLWADATDQALSGALAANLTAMTGAQVAEAPWPLAGFPDAEVTVRVDRMLADATGALRFAGRYSIASTDRVVTERIRPFDLTVPIAALDPVTVADAHARAWAQLSRLIARDL